MDVEYISLHGYIRNTPSETKSACRTPWEQTGVPDQRKRIYRTAQKEIGAKRGMLVRLDLPLGCGGTEAGVQSPHQDNCLSQRRNI